MPFLDRYFELVRIQEGVAGQAPLGDRERDRRLAMNGVPMRRILSVVMAAVVLLAIAAASWAGTAPSGPPPV